MSRQKLERVLELLINEETDKASDLLHDIFVEKSRKIYAKMIAEDEDLEDDLEEEDRDESDFDLSDDEEDFNLDLDDDEFENDLEGLDLEIDREEVTESEDDDMMTDMSDEDAEMDLADEMTDDDADDEMPKMDSEEDEDVDADDAFMNVEDALDDLKKLFAELVGDDENEDMDYDYVDEPKLEESATLTKVTVPQKDGTDKTSSPVASPKHDSRLKLANKEEKSASAPKAKEMGISNPQSNGGRLRKV